MMLSTAGSREALMGRQIALNYSHHHQFIQCHTYTYLHTDCRLCRLCKNFSILHSIFSHCCVATRSQALSGQVLCHYSRWNSSSKRLTTSTAFTSHEYEVVPLSYIYIYLHPGSDCCTGLVTLALYIKSGFCIMLFQLIKMLVYFYTHLHLVIK